LHGGGTQGAALVAVPAYLGILCMASISARHRRNSTVVKRSIELARRKTSVSLENEFWGALGEIARNRNIPIAVLIEQIHNNRTGSNLSSSIRLFVLSYFKTVSRPSPSNPTQESRANELRDISK
jgi:predicted DNA-binding ribbon-helix-helix protein